MRPERWLARREVPLTLFWIVWTAGAGYVLGVRVLSSLVEWAAFDLGPSPLAALMVMGLAPAALSAAVAWVSGEAGRPSRVAVATLFTAMAAGALCAPASYVLIVVSGGHSLRLEELFVFTWVVGPFVGGPLGAGFGVLYALVLSTARALRARASCADLDAALVAGGLAWMASGSAAALLPLAPLRADTMLLGWVLALAGFASTAAGVVRWEARRRVLVKIRAGTLAGWSMVPAEQAGDEAAQAPSLYPVGEADALIVSHEAVRSGPFRSSERRQVWARVPKT